MPALDDPNTWRHAWEYFLIAFLAGYLLGSIPFGILLTRLSGAGDLRKIGSGNIGATNVLRTGRKGLALATLLLDGVKGAAAVLIAYLGWGSDVAVMAGHGALIGHLFPVWLGFRGGKGVATALGILLASAWPTGLLACATWLLVAFLLRYSSLSALVAMALAPVYAKLLAWADLGVETPVVFPQQAEMALIIAVLVWIRHHENIRRLITGTEPKIGEGKKTDGVTNED